MFAVIETGGKQYLIKKGTKLRVEKLAGEVDQNIEFDKVLLTAKVDGGEIELGKPYLAGVKVIAKITKQARSAKIRVVKYKRKVRYHKAHGHRQHYTEIKIENIGK